MELTILDVSGKETDAKTQLSDAIFGINPNDHAIYLSVKQFLANKRQGTHKSKQRSEVAGSTRKLHRQKGTGGARAGDIKSPLFRGGGRIFGPQPRTYHLKLSKKLKMLARLSALSYKAKSNDVIIIENFTFDSIKTKNYVKLATDLNILQAKSLLVLPTADKNVYLSARNIKQAKVTVASQLNTYDVLHADKLLFTVNAIKALEHALTSG